MRAHGAELVEKSDASLMMARDAHAGAVLAEAQSEFVQIPQNRDLLVLTSIGKSHISMRLEM